MKPTSDLTSIAIFLAGGIVGAAVALALAPRSITDTRERLAGKVRDAVDSVRDLKERMVDRGVVIGDETARRVQDAGAALGGKRMAPGNGDQVPT